MVKSQGKEKKEEFSSECEGNSHKGTEGQDMADFHLILRIPP